MDIYDELGVKKYINGCATLTAMGGSRMPPVVLQAMAEASRHFVSIDELQEKAGKKIAEWTHNEAVYVSCGCAAGMVLSTAACITGLDPDKRARLPFSDGMKNEVIVQKTGLVGYAFAVRQAGGKLVEIGDANRSEPEDLENAINERTAAIMVFYRTVGMQGQIPLIRAPSISEKQRLAKRLFDLLFASLVILISAPLMMIITVLIILDSPGPIFFRQKRVGENMQPFEIIKFRTMIQNAEALSSTVETVDENGIILHKHRDDPRITRIGHFLRRYSLDEFPQFINVLLGNMSIVGPRPEMPYLVEKYKSWQFVRFTVPQGITGWWQVSGRSDKPAI